MHFLPSDFSFIYRPWASCLISKVLVLAHNVGKRFTNNILCHPHNSQNSHIQNSPNSQFPHFSIKSFSMVWLPNSLVPSTMVTIIAILRILLMVTIVTIATFHTSLSRASQWFGWQLLWPPPKVVRPLPSLALRSRPGTSSIARTAPSFPGTLAMNCRK